MFLNNGKCLIFFCLFMSTVAQTFNYPFCNGRYRSLFVNRIVFHYINRLMAHRTENRGWQNTPEAVLTLQLSDQTRFYERNATIEIMKLELQSVNEISMGKLASYSNAVRSLCLDPADFGGINITSTLMEKMKNEWNYDFNEVYTSPRSGWLQYANAQLALCLTYDHIPPISETLKVFLNQNSDGSFGDDHSVYVTSRMITSLYCIHRRMRSHKNNSGLNPQQSKQKTFFMYIADSVLQKAFSFIKNGLTRSNEDTWIGNIHSSPAALLALFYGYGASKSSDWSCREVATSLANALKINFEPETVIAQRIPILYGRSEISLLESWTCAKIDNRIPRSLFGSADDVIPPCDRLNLNCSGCENTIQIHLIIEHDTSETNDPLQVNSYLIQNLHPGSTLLSTMLIAQCTHSNRFNFTLSHSFYGLAINSINGVYSDIVLQRFWSVKSTNIYSDVTLRFNRFVVRNNDRFIFSLKYY